MALSTLLRETGVVGAGPTLYFSEVDKVREFQVVPHPAGFSGTIIIEGSSAATPGASDWFPLAKLTLKGHVKSFAFDLHVNRPWMRVNVVDSKMNTIAVHVSN